MIAHIDHERHGGQVSGDHGRHQALGKVAGELGEVDLATADLPIGAFGVHRYRSIGLAIDPHIVLAVQVDEVAAIGAARTEIGT